MYTVISIAAGGALGALSRHWVNVGAARILGADFPWGTLTVNIAGSFLMGMLISLFAHFWQPPQEIKLLLVTGFLGAFTTFSTFSLDVSSLSEGGRMMEALAYISASVIGSIASLMAGLHLVRLFSAA